MSEAASEADVQAVLDCLRSGWLTMGPRIQAFEAAFSEYTGAPHAVAVSSGTSALHLACLAAGVQAGDEVIVPAIGPSAVVEAPRRCGATAVFADVEAPDRPWISAADIVEERITKSTRAIIAVHQFGSLADTDTLREVCDAHGLVLIEDCRQAAGASGAGSVGDLGCFSFSDGRQLAVGEGGMVTARHEELAASVKSLRSHAMTSGTWDRHRGYQSTYDVVGIGFNFRMDEPRAALALSLLQRLDDDVEARRALSAELREVLSSHQLVPESPGASPSAIGILLVPLEESPIATGGFSETLFMDSGQTPNASEVAGHLVSIPIDLGGELVGGELPA